MMDLVLGLRTKCIPRFSSQGCFILKEYFVSYLRPMRVHQAHPSDIRSKSEPYVGPCTLPVAKCFCLGRGQLTWVIGVTSAFSLLNLPMDMMDASSEYS